MYHVPGRNRAARTRILATVAIALAAATAAAACGGSSSAKTAASPSPASAVAGTPGARGDRTPRSDTQTSIAEGAPAPGGFGNRTPSPDMQTAIAEGTPVGGFRGAGGFGGGQTITQLATLLGVGEAQLQTELQAPGATVASVAAAHGMDRAAVRQALIDTQRQRAGDAVTSGTLTQEMADAQVSQFEARVDQVLDGNGTGARPPGASQPVQ